MVFSIAYKDADTVTRSDAVEYHTHPQLGILEGELLGGSRDMDL